MSNIWVVSDWHFNHNNIIKYCNRPFASAQEMNEVMIERHNRLVKPSDKVYFLGDAYFGSKDEAFKCIAALNGKKRLILGNHDNLEDGIMHKLFERVYLERVFREEKMTFMHIPTRADQLKEGHVQVHGHIHDKTIMKHFDQYNGKTDVEFPDARYVNVCVEHTNYEPVAFEEVRSFKSKLVRTSKEIDFGRPVGKEIW